MAEYEPSEEELKALLGDNSGLTQQTQNAIEKLLAEGGPVVATDGAQSGTDDNSVGLVSQKGGTEFKDATYTKVETAVFDEGASGEVNLTSDNGITTELVNPNGLELNLGNGNNIVAITDGQSSVNTGDGDDNFFLQGEFTEAKIDSGNGDDTFVLDQDAQAGAEVSVDAGDGFDLMRLIGQAIQHQFEFSGGKFHMKSAGVEMDGVEVVGTDVDGGIAKGDHITVLAANEHDSIAAKLYQVAFGREAIDDGDDQYKPGSTLAGIDWWMNEFEKQADNDGSIEHLVRAFLNCDEFHDKYDGMGNADYVNTLYANLGATDEAQAAAYIAQLEAGSIDRETVAWQIAASDLAVQVLGNDGVQYVIDGDFGA